GLTFNEPFHDRPRHDLDDQKVRQSQVFSHSLGRKRPLVIVKYSPILDQAPLGMLSFEQAFYRAHLGR
ncbi:hypothetical protein, partial [Pseudomonas plecoglossicida]|uniref:hypothetical protein n=1 Tax=Pseudomonas plecoglossicida TaxID=70775 RepID=UPI003D1A49CC